MKLRDFTYLKEGGVVERYSLLVLNETPDDMSGISLGKLTNVDREKIIIATRAYEAAIQPYMEHFRKFRKGHIVDLLKETK